MNDNLSWVTEDVLYTIICILSMVIGFYWYARAYIAKKEGDTASVMFYGFQELFALAWFFYAVSHVQ